MRQDPVFRSGRMQIDYDHVETRYVLAGAYRARKFSGDEEYLSHLVFIGPGPHYDELRTGCRQPVEHVADLYSDPDMLPKRPTCPTCAAKWDKIPEELRGAPADRFRESNARRRFSSGNQPGPCAMCGKPTAENSGIRTDELLCARCRELADLENEHADGYHAETPDGRCPRCAAERAPNAGRQRSAEAVARDLEAAYYFHEGKIATAEEELSRAGISSAYRQDLEKIIADARAEMKWLTERMGAREPNASSVEWVPSEKRLRSIPSWGEHDFAWWKRQTSRGGEYSHPKVWIEVYRFEADGARARGLEFPPAELKQAKAAAKEWVEQGGMSASIEGRVRIAGLGDYNVQTFGEYRSKEDRGTYVWDVNDDGIPFSRKGPYSDVDEAYRDARSWAMSAKRDHVVTFGADPAARSFEILKGYKGWSGEVYFTSELAHVGRRLGEYR